MYFKKVIISTISIFFLAVVFTLCSSYHQSRKRKPNQWLTMLIQNAPETLDPRLATSEVSSNLSQLIFAPLFVIGEDLLPEPFLAKSVKQISRLKYEVTLKDNLFFQDKTPLTAKDVVFTFQSLTAPDVHSPHAPKFAYIQSIKALSKKVIEFKLKGPFAPFMIDLTSLGIMSKASCHKKSKACMKTPNGSGPYQLLSYNKATETLIFKGHQKWFEGPLLLENIEVRVVRDSNSRLLEAIKGKANFLPDGISPQQIEIVQKYPEQLTLKRTPGLGYTYIAFNLKGKPKTKGTQEQESEKERTLRALSNNKVRRAIAMSINLQSILKNKFLSMASRASGMIPPYHWAKSKKLEPPTYNPALAKTLLDEAGFKDRGKKNHRRFRVTLSASPNRFRQSLALIYQAQLKKVGIEVDLKIQDFASFYQDVKQGSFEMFSMIWTPVVEPDLFHWIFHSSNIPNSENAGGNRGGYKDPVLDKLIERARISSSLETRKKLYEKIELRLLKTLPYVPLWFQDEIAIMNRSVTNFTPSRTGSLLGLRHIVLDEPGKESKP